MSIMSDDDFVRLFQRTFGLDEDGWSGRDTEAKVRELAELAGVIIPTIPDAEIPDDYWPMLSPSRALINLCAGSFVQRIEALEAEQTEIAAALAELDSTTPAPVQLHPKAAENYARRIELLQQRLADAGDSSDPAEREVIDSVRDLIQRVDIEPVNNKRGAPARVILHGDLARFVRPEQHPT
ncbi:hypothetical protein [Brevundimonas sp.]|uniref:hypothetical protein n=1 Tax=Brevundimonas sp. TaxID=1871086 RepID=UPI0028B0EB92|nr:hypothetical protein [Brevundimonas sp.]